MKPALSFILVCALLVGFAPFALGQTASKGGTNISIVSVDVTSSPGSAIVGWSGTCHNTSNWQSQVIIQHVTGQGSHVNAGGFFVQWNGGDNPLSQTGTAPLQLDGGGHTWLRLSAKDGVYTGQDEPSYYDYVWVDVQNFGAPELPFQFHFPGFKNEAGVPAELRITQGGSPVPGSNPVPLQPGENMPPGDFTVPAGGPVNIEVRYPTLENDGPAWFLVPETPDSGTVANVGTITPTNTGGTPPTVTITPPAVPNIAPTPAVNKNVWTGGGSDTVDAERLDKTTYREGVDKITSAIEGKPVATVTHAAAKMEDALWKPQAAVNAAALSKLPTAPAFNDITPASSIAINLKFPKLHGGDISFSTTIDFATSPYSGPIAIFRGLSLIVITLVFFLASFYTVRGSFVSK